MYTKRQKHLFLLLLALLPFGAGAQRQDFSPRAERLRGHVYFLASDSLRGREAGSADAVRAAQYVVDQFREMGLEPYGADYLMPFSPSSNYASTLGENLGGKVDAVMESMGSGQGFRNVVAWIEGSDPQLKDEFIVVGAHYDHLGTRNGKVYNGADDNASGTACLIEVARQLAEHRGELARSVVLCAFDAEEMGLFGSRALANRMQKEKVCLMMSLDMVGYYRQSGYLKLEGTATLSGGRELAQQLAGEHGVNLKCKPVETSMLTATDTEPFAKLGFPTLAVTTGLKSPYHKPEDDADLIDYEGLDRIAGYIADLTLQAATRPELAPSGRLAAKHGGKQSPFQMGVSAGLGRLSFYLPDARVTTDSRLGWQAGLNARLNMGKRLSLRAAAQFEWQRTTLPRYDAEQGAFGNDKVLFTPVVVPVGLYCTWLPSNEIANLVLGAGGYWGWNVPAGRGGGAVSPGACGWYWSLGMVTGRVDWTLDFRYEVGFRQLSPTVPRGRGTQLLYTMTYYLW